MANLNAGQIYAVELDAPKIVCIAGAGTGKTHTLIERITRIAEKTKDPESILALTFTNAAAFEMRDRYRAKFPGESRFPEFRTFHSFCYYILCKDLQVQSALGYSRTPEVADPAAVKRLETQAKLQVGYKLSKLKESNLDKLTPKELFLYQSYRKAVSRLMKKDNVITFDELAEKVCNLFIEDSPLIKEYKDRFKYIFVDEFQDTDEDQWKFVQSFKDSNIFVCGDALQAIYGFRGAKSEIIKSLVESDEWQTVELTENFRSTKAICAFANNASRYAEGSGYRIEISSTRSGPTVSSQDGGQVSYMQMFSYKDMDKVTREASQFDGRSAILVRTNREVEAIVKYLRDRGIEFTIKSDEEDSKNFLKCFLETDFTADWLSTYLNAEAYASYIRLLISNPDTKPLKILQSNFGNVPNINFRFRTLTQIRRIALDKTLPMTEKVGTLLKLLGLDSVGIHVQVREDFEPKQILEAINAALEEVSNSQLYVGTVHSVKGLEFDNVFVMYPGGGTWKLQDVRKDEENYNLYYVAITRAKTNLHIFKGRDL